MIATPPPPLHKGIKAMIHDTCGILKMLRIIWRVQICINTAMKSDFDPSGVVCKVQGGVYTRPQCIVKILALEVQS